MGLNSCLYETLVMHCRIRPKRYRFVHKIFMFYLDLDELNVITKNIFLISHNKRNIYNFRDKDHFDLDGKNIKEKVIAFLQSKGVYFNKGKIMLLTNLRTFGYLFNPVSFYFCFDERDVPICVIPEIGNTFGEIKPFLIDSASFHNGKFVSQQKKFFYISPFIDLDIPLDFQLHVPDDRLNIQIDDFDKEGKFLYATMSGKRKELNNRNLFWHTMRYPFITLKVIVLIHYHALRLWMKKVPYNEKTNNSHLQREVYRGWNKN
ncbi:MAG: DUF1365 domain-containing protein [Candidatus Omnitrophica bacterium]|nr:DUF1365 domain-containing protein [Candidatus Omnitrophota bacterium]MCB9748078.1 DUF1365 domain-containing protein [Candidatus Omnitrophota bacterium]